MVTTKKEIEEMKEKILSLSFTEMKDKELLKELTYLFTALGDVFSLIRFPCETIFDYYDKKRYMESKKLLKDLKNKK